MDRDERVETLAKRALENAGHKDITIRPVKYAEGGPPNTNPSDSSGTWLASSDHGSFTFSLTVTQYNDPSDEQIEAIVLRSSEEAVN